MRLLITSAIVISTLCSFNTQILSDLKAAFTAGSAKEIAKYFDQPIDFAILENEDIISPAAAENRLDVFFREYPPIKFEVVHEGESGKGMKFVIGKLKTMNGTFRVSIYLNSSNSSEKIQQFSIDQE